LGGKIKIDVLGKRELHRAVARAWSREEGGWIVTVNVDILRRAQTDVAFCELISDASFRIVDGVPLVWSVRLAHGLALERLAGADLFWSLSKTAGAQCASVYLIGGAPGAAMGAQQALAEAIPQIEICGIDVPPQGFESDDVYMERLEARLIAANPRLVFVALGSPKQDIVITRLRHALPHAWFIGVGIAFSFASGAIPRAPGFMQRAGLEWLHRLAAEPRRLARRYLIEDLPFASALLGQAAWWGVLRRCRRGWWRR
jgi:N-acetylglucosaminyldiphosphoundecaprenol N-acetyl-beta-D-mannosaminyltransferase